MTYDLDTTLPEEFLERISRQATGALQNRPHGGVNRGASSIMSSLP